MLFDSFDAEPEEEDALPDLPPEPGLRPPRQMESCTGQDEIERALLDLAQGGRMPHALILAGPEGVGKATLAFRLARYLFKYGTEEETGGLFGNPLPIEKPPSLHVDPSDPVFRQVAAGGHPDLMTIGRETDEKTGRQKSGVSVDAVRKAAPFLRMTAAQGGWRIVIVDDADTMNRSAQNALLKILEEPPKQALLVLITHRIGALIPTICSRCRVINVPPLAQNEFMTLIRTAHPTLSFTDGETLYAIAAGSAGRGLVIAEEDGLAMLGTILPLLAEEAQRPWTAIHKLSDKLSRPGSETAYQAFCDLMLWTHGAVLRSVARQTPLPAALESLAPLRDHYSLPAWIARYETLQNHFDTFARADLDKRQAVLGAFHNFA